MWVDLKAGSLSILTLMFIKSPTLNVSANIDLAKVPQNEKNLSTITTDCLKFTNKAVVLGGVHVSFSNYSRGMFPMKTLTVVFRTALISWQISLLIWNVKYKIIILELRCSLYTLYSVCHLPVQQPNLWIRYNQNMWCWSAFKPFPGQGTSIVST